MITTLSIRCSWESCVLSLGSLFFLAALVLGGDVNTREKEPAGGKTAKRDAKEAAKMVEAIANGNKQPKRISRRASKPQRFPLYPKDYDWKEEERVRKAVWNLSEDMSDEVWEALVQKANDRRYCIASSSGSSDDLEMWSVGRVCYHLAAFRLCEVFEKHLPSYPPRGPVIQMRDVVKEDFPTWRKQRKDKALYQLQIEVCEIALRELPKLEADDISDKEKADARKKILAKIAELRRTKRPYVEHMEGRGTPYPYPRRAAEEVREAYEKGTLEKLQIRINK